MKSKYTSGPWIIGKASSDGEVIEIFRQGSPIRDSEKKSALQIRVETVNAGPTNWKNAALIAAAPDLLAAIEEYLQDVPPESKGYYIMLFRQLVRKATGGD